MSGRRPTYHEQLLHWIWENRQFDVRHLLSVANNKISIHHPGTLNRSDGPDFKNAEISIGPLRWYGDVEIHWKAADWRNHEHHLDAHYNNVILHVVFDNPDNFATAIFRKDQTTIPTLCLGNYLARPLESFLQQYLRHPQLPCAKHLSYISDDAFQKQINKAHKEYFEQKVEALSTFYDPDLPPSRAWLKVLATAFFDGLGISHNREPMQRLAGLLFDKTQHHSSADTFCSHAIEQSGIRNDSSKPYFDWKHKGCRPNNHPEHRIPQAALALWHIRHLPFERWLREDPTLLWQELRDAISHTPSLGDERADILFGTVFLPALYSLGNLFHSQPLKQQSWQLWQNHRVTLPSSLLRRLRQTDLNPNLYARKLGTIHQLRHYCGAGRCQKCFVFKKSISS